MHLSHKKFLISSLVIIAAAMVMQPVQHVLAQTTPEPSVIEQGLTITPFVIEQRLEAGKPMTKEITVINSTNDAITVTASIHDFVPSEDNVSRVILPEGQSVVSPYVLSPWLSIGKEKSFILKAQEQKKVVVTITPPADAEPGTRYGAVLFDYGDKQSNNTSETNKQVGTIIITKIGLADERGVITGFSAHTRLSYGNPVIGFETNFASLGNVSLKPKGRIEIRNMFGQLVAVEPINRDALLVFPKTSRDFEATWKPNVAFGRYTAKLIMVYGDSKLEASSAISFWAISYTKIVIGLVALCILLGILIFAIRSYNKWIITKATRNANK